MTDLTEEWRPVAGWPGYEVSNMGQVRSLPRKVYHPTSGHITMKGKTLRLTVNKLGYAFVTLRNHGVGSPQTVHRLVATAFLGDPTKENNYCAHWDGVGTNNVVTNLRWTNQLGNMADKVRHGTSSLGVDRPLAKLDESSVREIRQLRKARVPLVEIAARFGVVVSVVSEIANGKAWKHVT